MTTPVEMLSREVVERLLWRPEDTAGRLEYSIQQYNVSVLQFVEVKLLFMYSSCLYVTEPGDGCIIIEKLYSPMYGSKQFKYIR